MISDNDKNIIEKVTNISRDLSFKKEIKLQYRNICTELSQKYPEKADIIKQYSIKEKDLIIVLSILNKIKPQKGLEIGSFCGVSANGFLTMFSNLKLDCVDPWETFEIENTELIFNNLVDCYSDRIQKERAFFGSRNNHFNSQIDLNLQIFYPKNKYDFVFLDGDHRTSSLILAFMILKEYSDYIICQGAFFPQRQKAFAILQDDWSKYWGFHLFDNTEDGVGLFYKK